MSVRAKNTSRAAGLNTTPVTKPPPKIGTERYRYGPVGVVSSIVGAVIELERPPLPAPEAAPQLELPPTASLPPVCPDDER